jgi:2-oxoisovalerate dehydrogenase E1 component alpha subunit
LQASYHYVIELLKVFVTEPSFVDPEDLPAFPIYRVLTEDGYLISGAEVDITQQQAVDMYAPLPRVKWPYYHAPISAFALYYRYTTMVRLQAMDRIFFEAQRQGRITFYMENRGEEATHIGSAAGMSPTCDLYYTKAHLFL